MFINFLKVAWGMHNYLLYIKKSEEIEIMKISCNLLKCREACPSLSEVMLSEVSVTGYQS